MYAELLNWDRIPNDLLDNNLASITTLPDYSPFKEYEKFKQFLITDQALLDYIQQFFNFDVKNNSYYQIIKEGVATHIDVDRSIIYNYLIDTGGNDVYTVWYQEDKITENYRIKIPVNVWHKLDVTTYHSVLGITGNRIAITVFEKNK